MHILVVTQYFWPENFRINDIVTGLHQRGHQVTVLTGHPNYPSGEFMNGYSGKWVQQEQYENIRVIRVPMLARGKGSGVKLGLNYLSFALSGSVLGPLLARQQYDVIFVYEPSPMTVGFPAMAIKAKTGRPIAFYVQDLWPESLKATGFVTNPLLLKLVEEMVRVIYRACDNILVTSRPFISRVTRLGYPESRVRYLPQYAEAFYHPQPANPAWAREKGIPEGFVIMFAGNLGAAQDLFTVLEAASLTQLDAIQWVFLGDGSAKNELSKIAHDRNLRNVHFLGSYPSSQMSQFFAQADALLVSLKQDELFELTVPAKIQSYLACGRPLLALLSGEGASIIDESGSGLTATPGNPQGLAESARKLQRLSLEEREAMGKQGRTYFERHFERELILTELINTFQLLRSNK